MNITNILFLLFILAAIGIGAAMNPSDLDIAYSGIENASKTIQNVTFNETTNVYVDGLLNIMEEALDLMAIAYTEVIRIGIVFGSENPQYFEPSFIVQVIKWIVIAVIISLLIKPVFYILIFIVMCFIWIKELLEKRRKKKNAKS